MIRLLQKTWSIINTMVVIMVKHNEIKDNVEKLKDKVILDCHNIIKLPGVYHI